MSEPYEPDNLLDRCSDPATLQVHYDQEYRRERELLSRRLGIDGGDVAGPARRCPRVAVGQVPEELPRSPAGEPRSPAPGDDAGLAEPAGRSELDFDDLVRLDFLYLERWSVFLDLTIMLKTIPAVFRMRGAW